MSRTYKWVVIADGKPYDLRYFKNPNGGWYVHAGTEIILGSVSHGIQGWTAIVHSFEHESNVTLVEGFTTRHMAAQYILKAHHRTRARYNH